MLFAVFLRVINAMKSRLGLVFLWLSLLMPSIVFAGEAEDRMRIQMQAFHRFTLGKYADLQRSIDDALRGETRTSSGLWTLTMIDSGLEDVFQSDPHDEAMWEQHRRHVQAWVDAYPESAAPRLAYAQMLFQHGWRYRGGGFASTVDEADWAPFRKHVRSAAEYLESNKAIASADPRWYEYMAQIAVNEQWPQDRFDAMIDEGLKRYPTYYQLYFAAMEYSAPKWGGSAQAIEDFARAAVKRTRKTEGEGMYARIYWYAAQSQYHDALFTQSKIDWEAMKRGIHDVVARYPDAWNLNNFARFACLAGDRAETWALIDRIGDDVDARVWRGGRQEFEACRGNRSLPDLR